MHFQVENKTRNIRGSTAVLQQEPVQHPPHLHVGLLRQFGRQQMVETVQTLALARLILHHGHRSGHILYICG